jgi:hypothetical protein
MGSRSTLGRSKTDQDGAGRESIVTPTEIANLRKSAQGGLRHPVLALADAKKADRATANTEQDNA